MPRATGPAGKRSSRPRAARARAVVTAPLHFEEEAWRRGVRRVVGVDETGYGPLAGPVVAAAVSLRCGRSIAGANDSKTLTPGHREELDRRVRSECFGFALGAASSREVERLNARGAVALAMRRAVRRLPFDPGLLLVDGLAVPDFPEHRAIVRGDSRSQSIACASIIAKVTRDRLMHRLHPRYPEYGWITNHGYGTPEHREALDRHGPSPHHRRTFSGVAQYSLPIEA